MLSTYIGLKWYNAVGNPFEKHHFFDVACEWHAFIYYMHTELPTCTDSEEVSTSTSSKGPIPKWECPTHGLSDMPSPL